MGQQQLLLLVLGIVIVGLAVVVGIQAFSANQFKSDIDAHTNAGVALASQIVAHYEKPTTVGGLGKDASGLGSMTVADLGLPQNFSDTWAGFSRTGVVSGGVARTLVQNGTVPFLHIHRDPIQDGHARVEVYVFGPGAECIVTRHNRMPSETWSDGGSTGTAPSNPNSAVCAW